MAATLPVAAGIESVKLFDFDDAKADADWLAAGSVTAVSVELGSLEGPPIEGVAGRCLKVTSTGGGMVSCKPGKVPADWSGHHAIRVFLHRASDQKDRRLVFDVMATDEDGNGQLWRRLELAPFTGWARADLPLRFFGPGDGRMIRWENVRRLGFRLVGTNEVTIDAVSLLTDEGGQTARVGNAELSQLAFGKPAADTLIHEDGFVLMSDVTGVDFQPLVREMKQVIERLEGWLPLTESPRDPPVLLVFSNEAAYRKFAPKFAAAIKREIGPAQSGGFCINGIATGFWDEKQGLRRPTFLHEFTHSVIEKRLLLPNRSEWFQEAFANYLQMMLRPQPGLAEQVTKAILEPAFQIPLQQLCGGQPVPLNHYWQTFTLIDMMLADPEMRTRLPALITAFHRAGNTNLAPHLGPVLGMDWKQLETRWKAFTLGRYAKRD